MKIIKKTTEYSIYKKRNARYAIKSSDGKWLNAEKKIEILQDEDLIKINQSSVPEPNETTEVEAVDEKKEAEETKETKETTKVEESSNEETSEPEKE